MYTQAYLHSGDCVSALEDGERCILEFNSLNKYIAEWLTLNLMQNDHLTAGVSVNLLPASTYPAVVKVHESTFRRRIFTRGTASRRWKTASAASSNSSYPQSSRRILVHVHTLVCECIADWPSHVASYIYTLRNTLIVVY